MKNDYNSHEAEYLLREYVNSIKGGIDQIYYGILNYLDEKEQKDFLKQLKKQSDGLQKVFHESIIKKADEIKSLNTKLLKTNKELTTFKGNLEKKVEKRTKEIKKIQHVTIFALARLAEYRDKESAIHLKRVRQYSYLIAKELSNSVYNGYIDYNYVRNIYYSSPLHDIGKVGISDRILLKPAKLTSKEFEVVKRHTIIGGKTLEAAEKHLKHKTKSFLSMGKNIAFFHHEKWDGSGYPYGLKHDEIPLSARIVALADVYDAITTKRVYKDAMSHEEACDIIIDTKEKHFDPLIVEAFINLENNFKEISSVKIS